MEMLEYRYIFAGPCPGRVRSLPFEFKIEQETQTTTVKLKQRLCNCLFFVDLLYYCYFLFKYFLLFRKSLTLGGQLTTSDETHIVSHGLTQLRLARSHARTTRTRNQRDVKDAASPADCAKRLNNIPPKKEIYKYFPY